MTRRALNALKKSIEHYERMLAGTPERIGRDVCALCREFNDWSDPCAGCPVHSATGAKYCDLTPFIRLAEHVDEVHGRATPIALKCETCRDLLQAELDFLKSLLPKESK